MRYRDEVRAGLLETSAVQGLRVEAYVYDAAYCYR